MIYRNKKKYSGKPDVTQRISDYLFGLNPEDYARPDQVFSLTPELKTLFEIRLKITNSIKNNKPIEKIPNLYQLVSSTNLMIISHKMLSKNQGATTEGSENESVENFSFEKIKHISNQLINKQFTWSPIKQIRILKKNKKFRPLGIPNYSEKIVQNNILLILESIYEPIFESKNCSFGFRSHKSCQDAIEEITQYKNQGLTYAIEGDIKGAFDNVHPPTLAKMLSQIIDDKDFINIIFESCVTPIIYNNQLESSLIGTAQGSIISPILFNIYMHHFDIDVHNTLEQLKIQTKPTIFLKDPTSQTYEINRYKLYKFRKRITQIENLKKIRNLEQNEISEIKKLKKSIKKLLNYRQTHDRYDYSKIQLRYFYNRYADDFIILINKSIFLCKEIIKNLSSILSDKYKLTLSLDKTAITNLKIKHARYLGFTLFMQNRGMVINSKTNLPTKSGRQILCGPDLQRIYKRLIEKDFAYLSKLRPKACGRLIHLEDHEIIKTYNDILVGTYNYYYPIITYKSEINRIYYILYYSCIKTLAQKHKTTSSKIFKNFGYSEHNYYNQPTNRNRIVSSYTVTKLNKGKIIQELKYLILFNHRDLKSKAYDLITKTKITKEEIKKSKNSPIQNISLESYIYSITNNTKLQYLIPYTERRLFEDIWKEAKMNWRTTFKLQEFCSICGATENLESHHIRKIKGPTIDKNDTFTQTIMKNLNRKQLVVCQNCHNKIHNGQYSGLSLNEIYDRRIITIENQLHSYNTGFYDESQTLNLKNQNNYKDLYLFIPTLKVVINQHYFSQQISNSKKYSSPDIGES
jgi:retron-type reverse transcriptase